MPQPQQPKGHHQLMRTPTGTELAAKAKLEATGTVAAAQQQKPVPQKPAPLVINNSNKSEPSSAAATKKAAAPVSPTKRHSIGWEKCFYIYSYF
jgi:hypothetical protein